MDKMCKFLSVSGGILLLLLSLFGCNGDTTNITQVKQGTSSAKSPLNPYKLQQFVNPLTIIPVATPDTTTVPGSDFYTVSTEQTPQYDFGLRELGGGEFLDANSKPLRTTVWGYRVNGISNGYLGASIEARSTLPANTIKPGKPVVVKYINNLRDSAGGLLTRHLLYVDPTLDDSDRSQIRIVTHLHGGHTAAGFDGNPEFWFTNDPNAPANGEGGPAGNSVTYTYDNDQLATMLWYHDHAMGITRLNVYAGLAAFYPIRDDIEDAQNLPKGAYEIPLVIQDKRFNNDGSLDYPAFPLLNPSTRQPIIDKDGNPILTSGPEFFGNTIVVNGKVWPKLEVEPRKYRFRLLNGSDSRMYHLWLELPGGAALPANSITQIGNDGGLLQVPVTIGDSVGNGLLLSLAERADLIIDFSKFPLGTKITMRNDANGPFPGGGAPDLKTTGKIMQFTVTKPLAGTDTSADAASVSRQTIHLAAPTTTRVIDLQELRDNFGINFDPAGEGTMFFRHILLMNGALFTDPVTEILKLNTVEDWIIVNGTVDMHPIHLHLVSFEILEKGTATGYVPADPAAGTPASYTALSPNTDAAGLTLGNPLFDANYTVTDNERGFKDVVKVPPGVVGGNGNPTGPRGYVRIRAKFDRLGTYMYHCHILSHEDNAMMRPFTVVQ